MSTSAEQPVKSSLKEKADEGFFSRTKNPIKRRRILTFLCLFWIVVTPMFILTMVRPGPEMAAGHKEMLAAIPNVIPISLSIFTAQLVGLMGVWFMRRWGVLLYSFATVALLVFYAAYGQRMGLPTIQFINVAIFWGHIKLML